MRLRHAMGLAAALLPAACAPGLDGFDSYAGQTAPYAAPYAAEPSYGYTPSYGYVPPPAPYGYGVSPGIGPGYYGYDRDRGRRDWELRRERESRDAYSRDRQRQEFERREFDRRRFDQGRREDEVRRDQARREEGRRHEPQVVAPPPGRSGPSDEQRRAAEALRQAFPR